MKRRAMSAAALAAAVLLLARDICRAQNDADNLAKASQNPVADLTSFPLQFNFNSGDGLGSKTSLLLNVQPVMPLPLDDHWLLVARTVVPYVNVRCWTGEERTASPIFRSRCSSRRASRER
jgi:hypothetical protein